MDRTALFPRRPVSQEPVDGVDGLRPVLEWVRRRVGNVDHEGRVLQVAGALFDLTADLHGLGRQARWALSASALLHDVGRCVDPNEHARIGAEMILSDSCLPAESRRQLAYLTLYHRGPVPDLGRDEILTSRENRLGLRKVLGLLRAADTLDSRLIDPPRLLLVRRDRGLKVYCHVSDRADKARKAFCRPKKYRLLQDTIGCTIDVEVQLGEARMVSA
jgi:exopolyphosphatase/pppGpp-phosphohydrolase